MNCFSSLPVKPLKRLGRESLANSHLVEARCEGKASPVIPNPALDPQFLPELQLQSIHLAIISFMIVTAEVQQAMKNELLDLVS